jgi:BirA family biotin operon repressor/biotin-[acetyl-CoA-carboxylase] ligase
LARLQFVENTGSTNADLLADEHAEEGDWLVAASQSAGRGRQGRLWQSLPGNFLGSTLIFLRDGDPPAPSLALAAGLALIEAVDVAAPGRALQLKWPNDLMLATDLQEWAKLGGILLERSGNRVAAGFGVNLAAAPTIVGRPTASLDGSVSPKTFAPLLAASMARLLAAWRSSDPAAFGLAWQARAHPVGTMLEVHSSPGEPTAGRFECIEPDGALRLRLDDGRTELIRAGDVGFL